MVIVMVEGRELVGARVEREGEREGNVTQQIVGRMRTRIKEEEEERKKQGGCLLLRDEKLVSIIPTKYMYMYTVIFILYCIEENFCGRKLSV